MSKRTNNSLEQLMDTMACVSPTVHRKINREIFNKALKEAGARFPPHQLHILKLLYHQGETRVSYLEEELAIAKPQISHTIADLIKAGMIKRKTDQADKRRANLALTPKAYKKMDKLERAIAVRMRERF